MPDWDKGLGLGDGDDVDGEAGQPGKGKDKKEAGSDASSRSGKAVGTVVNTTNTTADAAADTPPTTASSWWFASTAIPLLAATTGPLSNVLSIAALVTPWRVALPDNGQLPLGADNNGVGIADPHWEIILNALSLACGFTGNFFLLLNFTGRARYIVVLPLSIIFWVLASMILIAISGAMHVHDPPIAPGEIYSQGFWHAVLAAILYLLGSLMLVTNMLGYVRGHYPQQFDLDDDQRTLILQTMMFFFWLAAGAGVYVRLEGWSYSNALYFADVSVLTVGFGDVYPTTNAGRGFLFVYELIGITSLGLVISSISRFVRDISANKIVKSHQLSTHKSTLGRAVTNEKELRDRLGLPPQAASPVPAAALSASSGSTAAPAAPTVALRHGNRASASVGYGHFEIVGNTVTYHEQTATVMVGGRGGAARRVAITRDEDDDDNDDGDDDDEEGNTRLRQWLSSWARWRRRRQRRQHRQQQHKLLLLREERDRFDAMRAIQEETRRFKQYYALAMAVLAFGLLWFMGALVFMMSEKHLRDLGYFEALYYGFVALLTIGYGDMSPQSNAGKAFFIVWSLIAVPTMTILVQEMGSTVVAALNQGTFKLADWTVMPKKGLAKAFVAKVHSLFTSLVALHKSRLYSQTSRRRQPSRVDVGGAQGAFLVFSGRTERKNAGSQPGPAGCMAAAASSSAEAHEHVLARQLAAAIRDVAHDLGASPPKRYTFEEWEHFATLIRFSRRQGGEKVDVGGGGEDDSGPVEWDWIGADSPMLADTTEAQWVLDRLCESLNRYTRTQARRQAGAGRPATAVPFAPTASCSSSPSSPPAPSHSSSSVDPAPAS